MRLKIFLVFLLLTILAPAAYGGLSYTPAGFRDLKWGDSHQKLGPDCMLIDKEHDYGTVYAKRNENLQIEGIQLQGITYSFYNDRLLNVTLEIAGRKDFDNLQKFASGLFGKCEERKTGSMESYRWDDENVFVIMDFIPQTSEGQLLVTYVPILEEVVQEIEKRRANIRPVTPQQMENTLH